MTEEITETFLPNWKRKWKNNWNDREVMAVSCRKMLSSAPWIVSSY
jgi:hypothetical protein